MGKPGQTGCRAGRLTGPPTRESKNSNIFDTSNGTDYVRKKYTPITKDLKIAIGDIDRERRKRDKDGNDETLRIKVNNVA